MTQVDSLNTILTPFWNKYPDPVVQLEKVGSQSIQGFVLTRKQSQELKQLLPQYTFHLKILEEATDYPLYTGKTALVNLYRDSALTQLSTQWECFEPPFKEIVRKDSIALIQKHEKTLGWVSREHLQLLHSPSKITPPCFSREAFLQEARSHLNLPYCFGGRSATGVDCSGLVQRALWNACSLNYPRHSRDQMKQGIRCDRGQERPGDLIFARPYLHGEVTSMFHVAIVSDPDHLIHACRSLGKVVEMSTSTFFTHYAYAGSRRISDGN